MVAQGLNERQRLKYQRQQQMMARNTQQVMEAIPTLKNLQHVKTLIENEIMKKKKNDHHAFEHQSASSSPNARRVRAQPSYRTNVATANSRNVGPRSKTVHNEGGSPVVKLSKLLAGNPGASAGNEGGSMFKNALSQVTTESGAFCGEARRPQTQGQGYHKGAVSEFFETLKSQRQSPPDARPLSMRRQHQEHRTFLKMQEENPLQFYLSPKNLQTLVPAPATAGPSRTAFATASVIK